MRFVTRASFRYAFSKIRGQRTAGIMICLGIAAGIFAMIMASSIMNGLQNYQLERLRKLESFDITVSNTSLRAADIRQYIKDGYAFDFGQTSILITDKTTAKSKSARIRAFDNEYLDREGRIFHLYLLDYTFLDGGIVVSNAMAASLNLFMSDSVEITFLRPGKTATIVPYTCSMDVLSQFSTMLPDYDRSTVLMNLDTYREILGERNMYIGITCPTGQKELAKLIRTLDPQAQVTTWQEYNSELYSSLLLEKVVMYIFLSFIFLIICINLRNSTRRLIENRRTESAMLRALGCTRRNISSIFLFQGVIICVFGEIVGTVAGLVAVRNIQAILSLISTISRLLTGRASLLTSAAFLATASPPEVALILAGVLAISILFTYAGCKRVFKSGIMEVVQNVSD